MNGWGWKAGEAVVAVSKYNDTLSCIKRWAETACFMKSSFVVSFVALPLLCGCAVTGPAISKGTTGNLEINVSAPQGMEVRSARIVVDDVFIGNVSEHMPVLFLKRGARKIRVELPGARTYEQNVDILGDPNHQVLNILLEKM
jgi:hypothetical protein